MPKLPRDCTARQISSKARQLVHLKFNAARWEFHEITGTDHGTDCIIELIEDNEFANHEIKGQIKGTRNLNYINGGLYVSFSMDIKTISYGLNSSVPFLLFYVDVDKEIVYYLPLQEYFIENPILFERLNSNKSTLSVHIPIDNMVEDNDFELQEIAKESYVGGTTPSLHRAI